MSNSRGSLQTAPLRSLCPARSRALTLIVPMSIDCLATGSGRGGEPVPLARRAGGQSWVSLAVLRVAY